MSGRQYREHFGSGEIVTSVSPDVSSYKTRTL
nr:MAG TPA: hypothetical protein [Caudoviricetes sp.]